MRWLLLPNAKDWNSGTTQNCRDFKIGARRKRLSGTYWSEWVLTRWIFTFYLPHRILSIVPEKIY